ncbi:unnamed protein product [Citrullus colocynthis]|uniref:Uncharacterized protein n=1 Tax=Citrullus colocynthis TaxID=252529 RepID=A0ABP0Z6G0_9ROSI
MKDGVILLSPQKTQSWQYHWAQIKQAYSHPRSKIRTSFETYKCKKFPQYSMRGKQELKGKTKDLRELTYEQLEGCEKAEWGVTDSNRIREKKVVDARGVRLCQRGCAGGEASQLEDKGGKVEWLPKPNDAGSTAARGERKKRVGKMKIGSGSRVI